MSKLVLITFIFVVIVIEVAAGTVIISKRQEPRARSARIALLVFLIVDIALVIIAFAGIFR